MVVGDYFVQTTHNLVHDRN